MTISFKSLGIFVAVSVFFIVGYPLSSNAATCSGTYAYDSSDLSDFWCPVTDLNVAYSAVPNCPSTNPVGAPCTGPCKINTYWGGLPNSCVIHTDYYSCLDSSGSVITTSCSAPVTATLVANPGSVVVPEKALLTWSSTGATSCTGTNFSTGGATSGTVQVGPQQTTTYSVSCTNGNQSASANATVAVASDVFSVSCSASPSTIQRGETATWSSLVTGGQGIYTYTWSGTDGLSGSSPTIQKTYDIAGHKSGRLKVTFTPGVLVFQDNPFTKLAALGGTPAGTWVKSGPTNDYPCTYDWATNMYPGDSFNGNICGASNTCTAAEIGTTCFTIENAAPNCSYGGAGPMSLPQYQQHITPYTCTASQTTPAQCTPTTQGGVWYTSATQPVPLSNEGLTKPDDCSMYASNAGYMYWNAQQVVNNGNFDPVTTYCFGVSNPTGTTQKPSTISSPQGSNPIETTYYSGNVCSGTTTSGQCPTGQTPVATFSPGGGSCGGGTQIGRTSEMLDGAQIGMWPDGWLVNQCTELGATTGDCCEYSQRASNNIGGGFPPNSYYQIRVVRGGAPVQADSTYIKVPMCDGSNLDYSCSSIGGIVGTQCTGAQAPKAQTIITDCSGIACTTGTCTCTGPNCGGVDVLDRTPQCRDSVDNDGDGKIDYPVDPGCYSPDDDDEVDQGKSQCSDGLDNDGNGLADSRDPACHTDGDPGNPDSYNPGDMSESSPQCSDGIDNDGNGTIDYPEDVGCSSALDDDEYSKASVSLKATPPLIKKGGSCTLVISASNVSTCTLTGGGITQTFKPGKNGVINETQIVSPKLSNSTDFTISCKSATGTVSEKAQCKVTPSFEEF